MQISFQLVCVALAIISFGTSAQTSADYENAKKNYTLENLQAEAFCGEASIVWTGESAAIEQKWIKQRGEFYDKKPGGTEAVFYNASQTDLKVLGMRVAGISNGGQISGVSIGFEESPTAVFAKLPGNPKMVKVADYPEANVTRWAQDRKIPRIVALSYKNFTLVSCERGYGFTPKWK